MLLFFPFKLSCSQFFLSFSLSFSCSTSDGSNATVSTLLQKKARTGLTLSMLNLQSLAMWWSTWWGSICTSQRFQWHFLIYFNFYNYLLLSAGFTCNSGWQVLFVPVCQMNKTMFKHDWKRANLPFSACVMKRSHLFKVMWLKSTDYHWLQFFLLPIITGAWSSGWNIFYTLKYGFKSFMCKIKTYDFSSVVTF